MSWKYFIGATILVAGALLPYAPLSAIVAGVAFAAFLTARSRGGARKADSPLSKQR